jgi:glycopeptide antibiotics resistance protein
MKAFSKIVFVIYVVFVLWLLLFKSSYDIVGVISEYGVRSFNPLPFAHAGDVRQTIENVLVFVPLGLLVAVNFKKLGFWPQAALVFGLSAAIEALQFALAIGRTDITDLLANTAGGLLGLAMYSLLRKHSAGTGLDLVVSMATLALLGVCVALRVFVFRIIY